MSSNSLTIYDINKPSSSLTCVYSDPSECPLCHFSIKSHPIWGCFSTHRNLLGHAEFSVNILFQCPHCQRVFLAQYSANYRGDTFSTFALNNLSPSLPAKQNLSASIRDISPMFAEAFSQSSRAESENLTEVAGCGYRKSVEYLVKDYLCHKFPDQSEEIKSEFLGNAIQRIKDPRIKTLAQRTVWIGNDETHYIKKHEALDIADMKRFITAMLHYIDAELALEEALSIEPSK